MKNWVTQQQLQRSSGRSKTVIFVLNEYFLKNLLLTLHGTPLRYLCWTVTQQRTIPCYGEHRWKPPKSNLQNQSILDHRVGRSWRESQYLSTSEITRHDTKIMGKYRYVFPVKLINISVQPWCKGRHTGHNPPQLDSLKEIPRLGILTILLYYPGQRMLHPLVC